MAAWLSRWRWSLAVAVLLLAALAYAFWPAATLVDSARVTRGPMIVGVTDDGVTRAEDFYVVAAPVTGYLDRIELEPGDRVVRGALVTRMSGVPASPLDPRSEGELQASLAAARASRTSIAASASQAERDLARAEELAGRSFLSRADLEQARTRVAVGRGQVQAAVAEIRRIEGLLARSTGTGSASSVTVRAPAGGVILSVLNESEGPVAQGTQLVTIGDPARIEVVADLLSREAARVSPGDEVLITQWGGDSALRGTVRRVEPFGRLKVSALGIEEQRVNVIIAFDPREAGQVARLGHGFQVDATVVLWQSGNALRVPIGALFRGEDGSWQVFVVRGGRAALQPVGLGHMNEEYGEVLEGLAEGEEVILNPGGGFEEGDLVAPRR